MTDPELTVAPLAPLPPPAARPARGARFVASALILLTTLAACLAAWQSWRSYWLVRDVLSVTPTATAEQLAAAHTRTELLSWAWLGGVTLSGIAFLAWLWRARVNAARICLAPQRLRIRWAVGAWFVPVANLWWPQMVLGDVWRASRPNAPADLATAPAGRLVGLWWGAFVAMHTVDLFAVHVLADESSVGAFKSVFFANVLSGGLAVVATVSILVVMRRVDRWQTGRAILR
ncbi:DUF4328 domain-containing protein [Actinokineospora iranica]|uniref:DUF4328 domain-containing protein n=1 Tax=Actinokineospora iranica TaxID=1271860 RepID=A0A1G6UTR7_9PSEU|nr:DUF4328 domain-containing protein [Actinokineospora iranica]SDD44693.1 protein of unknown function [Actinokineospora iranica]